LFRCGCACLLYYSLLYEDDEIGLVLLVCGLPGAGKSSLVRAYRDVNSTGIFIEYDEIEADTMQSGDTEDSIQAWKMARTKAMQQLEMAFKEHSPVVFMDDNFFLRSMRKAVYHLCQIHAASRSIRLGLIYYETPLDVCLERNQSREITKRIPAAIIERMHTNFESPFHNQAAWEANSVRLDGAEPVSSNLVKLRSFVRDLQTRGSTVDPPVDLAIEAKRIEEEQTATAACLRHQFDKFLRRCVQAVAKHDKRLARTANDARKHVLKLNNDELSPRACTTVFLAQFEDKHVSELKCVVEKVVIDWE